MKINIRHEKEQDYHQVEALVREAFWNLYVPGCDEHYLVHLLRAHPDYLPDYSCVAEIENELVGMIAYTRSTLVNEQGDRLNTLTFGPLCVHPSWQGKGVGKALVTHSLELAKQQGEKVVIILGHPRNYVKYGFKNGKDLQVSDASGKYPFGQLVLELEAGALADQQWQVQMSDVYNLDAEAVEAFDERFVEKEKKIEPSQEEFSIACRAWL
jgi:predicted N-acetyltransferase YhbS